MQYLQYRLLLINIPARCSAFRSDHVKPSICLCNFYKKKIFSKFVHLNVSTRGQHLFSLAVRMTDVLCCGLVLYYVVIVLQYEFVFIGLFFFFCAECCNEELLACLDHASIPILSE